MSVLKFGGSSLETTQKVQKVAEYVAKRAQNEQTVVVVSAMGKTTNALASLTEALASKGSDTTKAEIITQGENISAALLCYALEGLNQKVVWLDSKRAGIHSMGQSTNALITSIDKQPIMDLLCSGHIVVITGFQGENQGHIQALGRGGSDTTAVALGIVFNLPVEIHTDVDGFYNLDPKEFAGAKKKEKINVYSALESATAGAKVLDKRCLALAEKYKKPLTTQMSMQSTGSTLTFDPLEGFNIDCISCKNGFLVVENNTNLTDLIQVKIKNNNILFCQVSSNTSTFFLEEKTENSQDADLVVISGSGLNSNDFILKVYPLLGEHLSVCFHQTMVKVIVQSGQGQKLVQALSSLLH